MEVPLGTHKRCRRAGRLRFPYIPPIRYRFSAMLQRCFKHQCGCNPECTENTCFPSYPNPPHKRLRRRNACPAWVRHPSVPALSAYTYKEVFPLVLAYPARSVA